MANINIFGTLNNATGDPIVRANQVEGGYMVVANADELATIPSTIVKEGSLAYNQDDDKFYQYDGTQWNVADFGGGGDLSNYIQKSLTEGLVKNDGTIDETEYQERLIGEQTTGQNIKTINGTSILGEGNIEIQGGGNVTVDTENKLLLVEEGGQTYYTTLEILAKPNTPSISTTTQSIVIGNADFAVTSSTSGATAYYKIADTVEGLDEATYTTISGGNITIASGFDNDTENEIVTKYVKLKAKKNGLDSNESSAIALTINPKVKAGSISFTRNNNNNDYSTQATITFTASDMTGTTSRYTTDGGTTWTAFTDTHTETITTSAVANTFQVKIDSVTDYVDAANAQCGAITLNKKKFYYGLGAATLANEAAIQALVGGGSEEKDTMASPLDSHNNPIPYTVTASATGSYLWFCGSGTLSGVTSSGFAVPMNAVTVVDGYNCYRSDSPIMVIGANDFVVI